MVEPRPPWDDGLQNERTTLAWIRTSLSLVAVGTFAGKQSGSNRTFAVLLLVVVATAATMIVAAERRHHERSHHLEAGRPIVSLPAVTLTATSAVGLALVSAVVVLT